MEVSHRTSTLGSHVPLTHSPWVGPSCTQGEVTPQAAAHVAVALNEMGCYEVSMGDTIGVGTPASGGAACSRQSSRSSLLCCSLQWPCVRSQRQMCAAVGLSWHRRCNLGAGFPMETLRSAVPTSAPRST